MKNLPSIDKWLKEVKKDFNSSKEGMYLIHNGVVRETSKAKVREGIDDGKTVYQMDFSYDEEKVDFYIKKTKKMTGIYHVKVWLNEGTLSVGQDIMYVLIGGDIRPNVVEGLQYLVNKLKTKCVVEVEKTI